MLTKFAFELQKLAQIQFQISVIYLNIKNEDALFALIINTDIVDACGCNFILKSVC